LLDPLTDRLAGRVAVIVANLPYVPSAVWSRKDQFVRQAVRGQGDDGLGLYRQLVRQAHRLLEPGGHLILEMGPYQVDAFRAEIGPLGYSIESVEPEILGAVVVTVRLGDSTAGATDDGPVAIPGA
jgi:release factor glutamine methyltransferase